MVASHQVRGPYINNTFRMLICSYLEEFVAAGDFLAYKFPVWTWYSFSTPHRLHTTNSRMSREKGDASKARDFLPGDKQYLVTRGVPCLRRATSLAYTDADEDAERMLSFGDSSAPGNEADEWVETHAGRKVNLDLAANAGHIDDIPDLDGDDPHDANAAANDMAKLSISGPKGAVAPETPNLDDIPDMEEEGLEAGDEATAAPNVAAQASGAENSEYLAFSSHLSFSTHLCADDRFSQPDPRGQRQLVASADVRCHDHL